LTARLVGSEDEGQAIPVEQGLRFLKAGGRTTIQRLLYETVHGVGGREGRHIVS
jgi:hypothetical protein